MPAAGHPGTLNHLIRLGAMMPLLPLGALMLVRLPRNAIGWMLCATSLGIALAVAAQEYAVYSHFVAALPAERWVGWLGEWAGGPMHRAPDRRPAVVPHRAAPVTALAAGAVARHRRRLPSSGSARCWAPGEDLAFLGNPISNSRRAARR